MSIVYHPFCIEISLPVAAALLAFASKDDTRPHLGIGLEQGSLCATDGHCAVMFDAATGETRDGAPAPDVHHGRVWSRAHLETAVKVARAHKRKTVDLAYVDCLPDSRFPPIAQVMPEDRIKTKGDPIGFNPAYVGQLALVAKACGETGVKLTTFTGDLDPLGFRIGGGEGLRAHAAIMPMRI